MTAADPRTHLQDTPRRRTARDLAVDAATLCFAVLVGMVVYGIAAAHEDRPVWLQAVDLPLGALACLSLWWRRRHPMAVALLAVPALAMSNSVFGAGMVITANLALYEPPRRALPVLGLFVAASVPDALLLSDPHHADWTAAAFSVTYYLVFFAWGSALRSRRQLLVRLRADAERERADADRQRADAERERQDAIRERADAIRERAEHARRLADTRRAERTAIAREMHDVLAHRISLLSMHAGALAYRMRGDGGGPALDAAEAEESVRVIRDNAHLALEELREVLVVLRSDDSPHGPTPTAPQPRLADVAALVTEARAAGQAVDFRDDTEPSAVAGLRPQVQRTAYRAVQEALTNSRKHAPGSRTTVRLSGAPGADLVVTVANSLPPGSDCRPRTPTAVLPGAGAGLVGLGERVSLDGGILEHGAADGVFTVRVRLPWPTSEVSR
ncbi:histidine kinase [Actinacidiphila alni]|uniref:histidine kinase n=1 Tax=Actinacidiphila alni TaxID=380248 RepID=UPI003455495A